MLTLHHDITSPAAAVAVLRVQRLVDAGAEVRFSPLDVLGLEIAIPATHALLAAMAAHVDVARQLGLELRAPSRQPPTLRAHLLGERAEAQGLGAAWRSRCLRAYWTEDRDLHDTEVLAELAAGVGVPAAEARRLLGDRAAIADLRERMLRQRRRGIGGVPVLELDGTFVPAELPDQDLWQLAGL